MAMPSLDSDVVLNNGVKMPLYGLGLSHNGGFSAEAVAHSLRRGVRLLDTAARYGNEEEVGQVVAAHVAAAPDAPKAASWLCTKPPLAPYSTLLPPIVRYDATWRWPSPHSRLGPPAAPDSSRLGECLPSLMRPDACMHAALVPAAATPPLSAAIIDWNWRLEPLWGPRSRILPRADRPWCTKEKRCEPRVLPRSALGIAEDE